MTQSGTARCAFAMSIAIASAAPAFAQGLAASAPEPAPAGGHRIAEPAPKALYRRATQADADALLGTLNRLLDAYQTGDLPGFDALLASSLPGRQRVVEGLIRGLSGERHARIHLFDVQVTAGPETAAIQAGWEKRSLTSANFAPQLERGRFKLLARRAAGHGGWLLTAIEGDNPFAPATSTAIGARLTLGAASITLASLSSQCPGTTPPAVVSTPLAGSLTGTATFAARSNRATATLAGSVTGVRVGSVPVTLPDYAVTLTEDPLPGEPVSVPISIVLTAAATGGAGGPFAITAAAPGLDAPITYPDPGQPSILAQGVLMGTVTIDRSDPHAPKATGLLSGTLTGAGLVPITLNQIQVGWTIAATSGLILPSSATASVNVSANLNRQDNGRYAGIGQLTDTLINTIEPRPRQVLVGLPTPSTLPVRGGVSAPSALISARLSGPPIDLRLTVPGSQLPCAPVALSIEVQSAALQGQGGVTVQITTEQGDREALSLPEVVPGRFARQSVSIARTGGARPGNGVVDIVDPGGTLTVTFVDAQPLPGRPPLRPLTGTVRVQ